MPEIIDNVNRRPLKIRGGPDGIHLFNRQTGMNILIDEAVVPPKLWAAAPRQVSIALTNACDLQCAHCYAPKTPAKLDFEQLISWIDELDANGCFGIGFGGGEPTLHRDFVEICRHVSENTDLAVTFTTHGHHLNDRLASELKDNVHFIRISMDGVGATYESIRGKSFDVFRKKLDIAHGIAPFGINYVVNSRTLPDLEKAITLAMECNAAEFLLLPEQPVRGRGGIDNNSSQALRNWVNSYYGKIRLCVSERGATGLPICDPLQHENGIRSYAHIDADGILKRSSYAAAGVSLHGNTMMCSLKKLELTLETVDEIMERI